MSIPVGEIVRVNEPTFISQPIIFLRVVALLNFYWEGLVGTNAAYVKNTMQKMAKTVGIPTRAATRMILWALLFKPSSA